MNGQQRTILDQEPVPVANGQPASACVVRVAGGWYLAWLNGTAKQPFGDPYPSPRDAARAATYLNERAQA